MSRIVVFVLAALLAAACSERGEEASTVSTSGSGERGGPSRLEDLPSEIRDFVALDAVSAILPAAQLEVIDYYLKDEATTPEESALLERHKLLLEGSGNDGAPPVAARHLDKLGITLVDPRPVSKRLVHEREAVEDEVCGRIELVDDADASGERHNLIVFYVKNVLGLCGERVDWRPADASSAIGDFYALFADGNYYKNLDAHLEDFRNEPFMRRHNLFEAVYFQYLRLAFEARSIDFPRREFVDRRLDLRRSCPELKYLSEYFAVMVRAGLAT